MRKFLITILGIVFVFVFLAATQDKQKSLTDEDIVKATLPVSTIIMTTERSSANRDVSAQSLIQLNTDVFPQSSLTPL